MEVTSYLLGKKSSGGGGGGADLSDYFYPTISEGTSNVGGYAKMIKTIPNTTTVSGTTLNYAFNGFLGTTIPLLDTSNVTDMSSMFRNCINLISVPLLDTSNVTGGDMMYMFNGCTSLTTVPILNTSNVTRLSNMFTGCPSLTDASLDNILQMCINSNAILTARKSLSDVGFTSTNYPVSRIESLPHYQDFINAGWTIGY